ncbi:hypothetical protein BOTCAL_0219g00080 [Botryotinia calthae]|uniref:Uncharacterized protein n=1 Tax=Botryotinia calthae TaxID=38488 RepID=A0A4Y8D0U8_9HELO|nr:hypothetical protein BOTCAL_0219g00080 [Botryotinia calthae]
MRQTISFERLTYDLASSYLKGKKAKSNVRSELQAVSSRMINYDVAHMMSTLVPSGYAEKTLGLKKIFDLYQIVNDAIDHFTLRVQSPQLRPSIAFVVKGFPFGHATSTSNETAKQDWNKQCGKLPPHPDCWNTKEYSYH